MPTSPARRISIHLFLYQQLSTLGPPGWGRRRWEPMAPSKRVRPSTSYINCLLSSRPAREDAGEAGQSRQFGVQDCSAGGSGGKRKDSRPNVFNRCGRSPCVGPSAVWRRSSSQAGSGAGQATPCSGGPGPEKFGRRRFSELRHSAENECKHPRRFCQSSPCSDDIVGRSSRGGQGGRRRPRGLRGRRRGECLGPHSGTADPDSEPAGFVKQEILRPVAESVGRRRGRRRRSQERDGREATAPRAIRRPPRKSCGESARAVSPRSPKGLGCRIGTEGYVSSLSRNRSPGYLQNPDLLQFSDGGDVGSRGAEPRCGTDVPPGPWLGIRRTSRQRTGPHEVGLATDGQAGPAFLHSRTEASSEARATSWDAGRSEVGHGPAGISEGCRPDFGEDHEGAFESHSSGRPARPGRWNQRPRTRKGPQRKEDRPDGRDHGMKTPWFLPQLFPSDLDGTLSASRLSTVTARFLPRCRTRLSQFIQSSIAHEFPSSASQISSDLWPCPLPPPLALPRTRLGGRREARWRQRCTSRLVCRHIVAAYNWLVLNRPSKPPADLPPPSSSQAAMLVRLERMASIWIRLGHGPKCGLDRTVQKFDSISSALSRIHELSRSLYSELQPYSSPSRGRLPAEPAVSERDPIRERRASFGKAAPIHGSKQVEPSRLKFDAAPQFNAEKFLTDPLLRAGFQNPSIFRRPSVDWGKPRLARVQSTPEKQRELFRKWDNVHSLYLLPAECSEHRYRCGLFSVFKNSETDRQILNPIPENSRSFSVSDATLSLAHSSLLCQLYVPEDRALVINADDISDFYHGFTVSDLHAARNHIHGVYDGEEFAGWNAFREDLRGKKVVGCFKTLAMGTSFAVEIAQHAHAVLLYRSGCLRESERVAYKHILPAGPGFDLLCIDDHIYLLMIEMSEVNKPPAPNRRDAILLARAASMYAEVGLRTSPKKAVRNTFKATILGGELDGIRGDIAAPRVRIVALASLSLQLIVLGFCTKELLQCILGCWVFVCMYRRPFLCLMNQLYHEIKGKEPGEIFSLSHGARQELLLLVLCSPCIHTDLRAPPLGR